VDTGQTYLTKTGNRIPLSEIVTNENADATAAGTPYSQFEFYTDRVSIGSHDTNIGTFIFIPGSYNSLLLFKAIEFLIDDPSYMNTGTVFLVSLRTPEDSSIKLFKDFSKCTLYITTNAETYKSGDNI